MMTSCAFLLIILLYRDQEITYSDSCSLLSSGDPREADQLYYEDEPSYHPDILERSDLFYGHPDEIMAKESSIYPNGMLMDDPEMYKVCATFCVFIC